MKMPLTITFLLATAVFLPCLAGATSLSGKGSVPDASSKTPPQPPPLTQRDVVKKYVKSCGNKAAKEANCAALRKETVEIVKESLLTLGSSAKRTYVPKLVRYFKSDEVVLRVAAADAIGMIGPQDQDVDALIAPANDPVPDVRRAVSQAIGRGKGTALSLLVQRTESMPSGLTPDVPPDASKFSMPVAPDSTYLFFGSDPVLGRLSYLVKDMNSTTTFFRGKAKKGPFKPEEFQEKYRYQLQDELEAQDQAHKSRMKELEKVKPDPTNQKAMMEFMGKLQSEQMGQMTILYVASSRPNLFGAPTVYVLEERQIGQRSYPTRYVVVYQDHALKRPGYRLVWMTASDSVIKTVQTASLAQEQQEAAQKKRQDALDNLTQKKDATEQKQFKKGQEDLEKELGF